jgi:hypothetical protein
MRLLRALAVLAICMGVASAQVTPVIPTGTVLGNSSGSAAVPSPLTTLPAGLLSAPGTIGGTTPSPATFTNLTANGTVSGSGFASYLSTYLAAPAAIGGTTPAAAGFTTLAATGLISNNQTFAVSTVGDGLILSNSTAATGSGTTAYSPALHLQGHGWSGSASVSNDWRIYDLPTGTNATFLVFSYSFNGGSYDNGVSFNQNSVVGSGGFSPNSVLSASNCANCYHLVAANNPAISSNTTDVMSFLTTGITALQPVYTGTTPFTVSGCGTAGSVAGNGTTGTFTVGTGSSSCTFTFTINGSTGMTATHGWIATVFDTTAGIYCIPKPASGTATTSVVLCNSTITTGDLISFHADPY